MMLFTNLEDLEIGGVTYNPYPILKLTTGSSFDVRSLNESKSEMLGVLKKEANINGFKVVIND